RRDGRPPSPNLMQAGYAVTVYNRTRARAEALIDQGATYAATPCKAAEGADVVISMVRDDAASRQVWLAAKTGAIHSLNPAAIAIEASTLTIRWVQHLATALAEQQHTFLAIPVVGSRPQAEAKRLIGLAGGDTTAVQAVQSLLAHAGISTLHVVGTASQAMTMKLAVNVLFGAQVAALAEMLTMLTQSGLQAAKAMDILRQIPITSPAMQAASGLMINQQHVPLFPIDLVEKDFRYAAESTTRQHSVCQALQSVYQQAIAQGYGGDNITGIIQLFT
ncbi:MAG: NAD(P)-dependent oxidoreductase, partial [Cyanobacteria bacterium J06632_22]